MPLSQFNPSQIDLSIEGIEPSFGDVYISGNNIISGNVSIEDSTQIFMSNIIESQGQNSKISIGKNCNIQDLCLIQATFGQICTIGPNVFIGSNSQIINAEIGPNTIIGCGVKIYPNVKIGGKCFIASGSVIPEGSNLDSEGVYAGSPARFIRKCLDSDLEVFDEIFIEQEKVTKIIKVELQKEKFQISLDIKGALERQSGETYYSENLPGENFDRFEN